MPQFLSPVGNDQFIDANGDPLTGGQVETYLALSSTPAATYTSSSGGVAQSNPIILNSLGYAPSPVWLTGGIAYKFIIKDASGSTLRTIDNISGVNDASVSQSEWVESGLVPTYIGATSFSVPGDQTPTLQIGRRVRTTNTSGLVYSTVSNSVFAAGITTVTLTNDSTTLDAGLSLVAYALLAASPVSVPNLPGSKITGLLTSSSLTMNTDRVLGRVSASTGAIEELTRSQLAVLSTSKIQPITATVAANALTVTINPTTLDFRSTTLGDGTVTTVSLTSSVSCVVPNGATLGSANAVKTNLAVLAVNNAGTIEVAVVALSGSVDLSEDGLLTTTALSTGSDLDNVVYSTTARTNVAYRIVGFIEYTQATAGVYATAPSLVGGKGDPLAKWMSGYGQTWQTVTRNPAVTYTNSTGRPIQFVAIGNGSAATQFQMTVGAYLFPLTIQSSGGVLSILGDYEIPAGATYSYTIAIGSVTSSELR